MPVQGEHPLLFVQTSPCLFAGLVVMHAYATEGGFSDGHRCLDRHGRAPTTHRAEHHLLCMQTLPCLIMSLIMGGPRGTHACEEGGLPGWHRCLDRHGWGTIMPHGEYHLLCVHTFSAANVSTYGCAHSVCMLLICHVLEWQSLTSSSSSSRLWHLSVAALCNCRGKQHVYMFGRAGSGKAQDTPAKFTFLGYAQCNATSL